MSVEMRRLILEMGTGNDLYGQDYTKAAIRAVQDAMHHSSLTLFKSLALDPQQMQITVTIGVAEPAKVDADQVAKQLPYGEVCVKPVKGGMDVPDPENGIVTAIATAAIEAFYPIRKDRWKLVKTI